MSSEPQAALIAAARAGDQQARDRLVADCLPLVYNIVGRALNGHADVDDVVQETMLRVLAGLDGLRSPEKFRSWLVAITMNQLRGYWRRSGTEAIPAGQLEDTHPGMAHAGDFVDLAVLRLGLSGQRREVAQATRWLDASDRALLSLWWLEAAGELTRAEVAAALELSPQHTAVRVQRMKAQLDTARVVVRALAAEPRCILLEAAAVGWDGVPTPLWRKRLARHTRDCTVCSGGSADLVPAEGLLVGLALVPVAFGIAGAAAPEAAAYGAAGHAYGAGAHTQAQAQAHTQAQTQAHAQAPGTDPAGHAAQAAHGSHGSGGRRAQRIRRARRRRISALAAACVVLGAGGGALYLATGPDDGQEQSDSVEARSAPDPSPGSARPSASPSSKSPSPSASPSREKRKEEKKKRTPSKAPSPRPSSSAPTAPKPAPEPEPEPEKTQAPEPDRAPAGVAAQVTTLVNAERSKNGCGPLRVNSKLNTAAQRHSADMGARDFFDHENPDGEDPGDRITAAGYKWTTYGENIAFGQQSAAEVMQGWMDSPGHRANILNCDFKEIGVGRQDGTGGPWWTQVFGAAG